MYSLRLLGATDLRDADDVSINGLLAQQSRVAVLAYLGVRGERFVRRDELLRVFWPEMDEARGRNALSQAIHVIRRALPPHAVVTRGVEVGIDTRIVKCDVVELERLARAGDDAGVVAAYTGELLPGFTLPGVPGFERWLEAERARLAEVAAQAAAKLAARSAEPVAPAKRPTRRLQIAFAVAGALAILGATGLVARARSAGGAPPSVRIAVMPFRVFATPDLSYLSGGMMDVLSLDMDGIGPVRTIDPHAVASFVAHSDTADQLALGTSAAKSLSADRFVLGTVVVTGTKAKVSATLYSASGAVVTSGSAEVEGTSNVLSATDGIARELLAHELPSPAQGLSRLAALTSSSTTALRHYLEGERFYREGRFTPAVEAFGAAVQLDSTFALGNYRLAASLDWGIHVWAGASQYDYLARALRHMERLGGRDQQLIRALHEFWQGSPANAAQLYRNVLADEPDDVEAWEELAEVTFHRLVPFGTPIGSSRAPFENVLRLDPENVNAMVHLTRLAALRGDDVACDSLARRVLALAPTHDARFELRVLAAVASPDTAVRARALDVMASIPSGDARREDPAWLAVWRVATFREDPMSGLAMTRSMTDGRRPPSTRLLGEIMAANMSAALGRWDDASHHLDAAGRIDAAFAWQVRSNITLLGPFDPTPARLAQLHAAARASNVLRPLPSVLRLDSLTGAFARGLEAVQSGDSVTRDAAEHELETQTADMSNLPLYRFQANVLRVRALRRAGASRDALALLERSWLTVGVSSSPQYARGAERMLRADLLHALGRDREALTWYQSIPEDLGMAIMYAAPAHLGAARAYDALGDRASAAREYGRVADLWRSADGELKVVADEARRRAVR